MQRDDVAFDVNIMSFLRHVPTGHGLLPVVQYCAAAMHFCELVDEPYRNSTNNPINPLQTILVLNFLHFSSR